MIMIIKKKLFVKNGKKKKKKNPDILSLPFFFLILVFDKNTVPFKITAVFTAGKEFRN